MMKFLTPHRIGVLKGDQPVACKCYVHLVRHHDLKKGNETLSIHTDEELREEKVLKKAELYGLEEDVQIGASLTEKQVEALTLLMIDFKELFA